MGSHTGILGQKWDHTSICEQNGVLLVYGGQNGISHAACMRTKWGDTGIGCIKWGLKCRCMGTKWCYTGLLGQNWVSVVYVGQNVVKRWCLGSKCDHPVVYWATMGHTKAYVVIIGISHISFTITGLHNVIELPLVFIKVL